MKHKPKHPHLDAVLNILRLAGATVRRVFVHKHIVVLFEIGHRVMQVFMPASPPNPDAYAEKACRGLERKLREARA